MSPEFQIEGKIGISDEVGGGMSGMTPRLIRVRGCRREKAGGTIDFLFFFKLAKRRKERGI